MTAAKSLVSTLLCVGLFAGAASAQELFRNRAEPTSILKAPAAAQALADRAAPGVEADDYEFVNWCAGVLSNYVAIYPKVMPEVTRIESQFREGASTTLTEDLKVYADMQSQSVDTLRAFGTIIEATETASKTPIAARGSAARQRGRNVWSAANSVSNRVLAQEWMSWTLPARCESSADNLERAAVDNGALPKGSALMAPIKAATLAATREPVVSRPAPVAAPITLPTPEPKAAPRTPASAKAAGLR